MNQLIVRKNNACTLVFILCLTGCSSISLPSGKKLLTVQIESQGQVVLEGIVGVSDRMAVDQMWNVLGDLRFESTHDIFQAKETGQQSRSIVGTAIVKILHVDEVLASRKIDSLSVVELGEGEWCFSATELSRIKQAEDLVSSDEGS